MTRKPTPNQCDICNEDIDPSQMSYQAQFSQRQPYGSGIKNRFVSSLNRCDFCKKCFLKTQEGNFTVKWKILEKQKETGEWLEVDPQQTIEV